MANRNRDIISQKFVPLSKTQLFCPLYEKLNHQSRVSSGISGVQNETRNNVSSFNSSDFYSRPGFVWPFFVRFPKKNENFQVESIPQQDVEDVEKEPIIQDQLIPEIQATAKNTSLELISLNGEKECERDFVADSLIDSVCSFFPKTQNRSLFFRKIVELLGGTISPDNLKKLNLLSDHFLFSTLDQFKLKLEKLRKNVDESLSNEQINDAFNQVLNIVSKDFLLDYQTIGSVKFRQIHLDSKTKFSAFFSDLEKYSKSSSDISSVDDVWDKLIPTILKLKLSGLDSVEFFYVKGDLRMFRMIQLSINGEIKCEAYGQDRSGAIKPRKFTIETMNLSEINVVKPNSLNQLPLGFSTPENNDEMPDNEVNPELFDYNADILSSEQASTSFEFEKVDISRHQEIYDRIIKEYFSDYGVFELPKEVISLCENIPYADLENLLVGLRKPHFKGYKSYKFSLLFLSLVKKVAMREFLEYYGKNVGISGMVVDRKVSNTSPRFLNRWRLIKARNLHVGAEVFFPREPELKYVVLKIGKQGGVILGNKSFDDQDPFIVHGKPVEPELLENVTGPTGVSMESVVCNDMTLNYLVSLFENIREKSLADTASKQSSDSQGFGIFNQVETERVTVADLGSRNEFLDRKVSVAYGDLCKGDSSIRYDAFTPEEILFLNRERLQIKSLSIRDIVNEYDDLARWIIVLNMINNVSGESVIDAGRRIMSMSRSSVLPKLRKVGVVNYLNVLAYGVLNLWNENVFNFDFDLKLLLKDQICFQNLRDVLEKNPNLYIDVLLLKRFQDWKTSRLISELVGEGDIVFPGIIRFHTELSLKLDSCGKKFADFVSGDEALCKMFFDLPKSIQEMMGCARVSGFSKAQKDESLLYGYTQYLNLIVKLIKVSPEFAEIVSMPLQRNVGDVEMAVKEIRLRFDDKKVVAFSTDKQMEEFRTYRLVNLVFEPLVRLGDFSAGWDLRNTSIINNPPINTSVVSKYLTMDDLSAEEYQKKIFEKTTSGSQKLIVQQIFEVLKPYRGAK